MESKVSQSSWISLSLAITLIASLITFTAYLERRITRMETLIENHQLGGGNHRDLDRRLGNIEHSMRQIEEGLRK